jgi:acyl-coenzyme A thioesterase PaaI-like protein
VPENLRSRLERVAFNLFPAYRGTGARVTFIAADYSEVRITLPLNRRTRNYVGTIFGGSMYGAIDPVYMLMLMKRLGKQYIVWDKAATIRFRRPGRSRLFATFQLTSADVDSLRQAADTNEKVDRQFLVDLVDAEGVVHASFEKLIHVRRKPARPS